MQGNYINSFGMAAFLATLLLSKFSINPSKTSFRKVIGFSVRSVSSHVSIYQGCFNDIMKYGMIPFLLFMGICIVFPSFDHTNQLFPSRHILKTIVNFFNENFSINLKYDFLSINKVFRQ